MKINKIILLLILLFPKVAFASPSANMSCSSVSNASVGDTITVTVKGSANENVLWDTTITSDNSKLKYTGGNDLHSIKDSFSTSTSFSYSFKAVDKGVATVSSSTLISNENGEEKGYFTSKCSINIGEKVEKSSNNYLKSLSIDNATISPEFNKDTLEYSASINSDNDTKININASAVDGKSSISGTGSQNATLGLNKYNIVVTAENGTTRTYTINVTVNEANPIIVKINGKKYTVVRKVSDIQIPEGFEKTSIKIEDKDVDAFKNEKTGYLLVVLIDEKNNTGLFSYNEKNNSYKKYQYYSNSDLNLIIVKPKNSSIPYKYKKNIFKINGDKVTGYAFDSNSKYRLVYALNLDTMKKKFLSI